MIDHPELSSRPGWLNKIMRAKAEALASLTADELAEAAAERVARRARVEARRLAKIARAKTICSMFFDGCSDVEIGAAIGRTDRAVRSFAEVRGFTIPRSKTSVRRLVPIAREGEDALRRLAEAHGLAPAAALEHLVALILSEEAEVGRKLLRNPDLAREALAAAFGAKTGGRAA